MDNKNRIVSVILLTYKNQKHIYETIQSILDQDYPEIELIVSDDASGHFDQDRIKEYIENNKTDNIMSVTVRQNPENMGTVAHMNLVAVLSIGKYIKFISCGDKFYDKSTLKKLCAFIKEQNCTAITSMSAVCSQDFQHILYHFPSIRRARLLNKYRGKELFGILSFSNIVSALGCLFHDSFFKHDGGFDESYRLLEDYPAWLKIARSGGRIPCLNEISTFYTVGGVSSKDGTAFEAKSLKEDMILCFEKEILPYVKDFPFFRRDFTQYQYLKLRDYDGYTPIRKLIFVTRYLPYISYRKGKAAVKYVVKKIRMG